MSILCQVFLQLNKNKEEWLCPVCNINILPSSLRLDTHFQIVLLSNPGVQEVTLNEEGGWSPVVEQEVEAIEIEDIEIIEDEIIIDNNKNGVETMIDDSKHSEAKKSRPSQNQIIEVKQMLKSLKS